MTLPKMTSKIFAAAVFAATIPVAAPTSAAPLAQSLALNTADVGAVEQVQYRRWHGGRWIGPAAVAGFAAGAIVGSALAPRYYNDGYYAYGAAPGYDDGYYAYGAAPGYVAGPRYRGGLNRNFGNGSAATGPNSSPSCPSDREQSSAYPSWMCR